MVSGRVALEYVQVGANYEFQNLQVGLAYPDEGRMSRQNDAKHYELGMWARRTGSFAIADAWLGGDYELHAIADSGFGEFAKAGIKVPESGQQGRSRRS